MSEIEYNINEIIDFNDGPPIGDYVAKVVSVELGETKAGDPKVVATFEVIDGEHRNTTFDKTYLMKQGKTKNGGSWCRGISDLKADARAVGALSLIPKSFTLPQARKIFSEVLGKKKLLVNIRKEPAYNDPTKEYNRYTVVGLASGNVSSEAQIAELLG